MSSGSGGIGSTLTGGIQDIAAFLPLLGTEQCAIHVSSALTRGYLYAASAPMSIFGSVGVVSAGFRTLVACFAFRDIEGAKILANMGFEPQGENLSLIMIEGGKGENKGRYVIENRMDAMIDELNIDKNRITGVSHKSVGWNIKMMATTALLCTLSIAPYIYINLRANNLDLKRGTIWVFPILRSTGGFITATLIQILIQRRITIISSEYLVKREQQLPVVNGDDVEAAAGMEKKKYQMDAHTWPLLFLLLLGLLASVVGYVGCFSIVQNSASTYGPVSWLCLEVGLSVVRLAIWAWNPTRDDAPPLEINLELDEYEPLPTCNKDNEEILECKMLPLTRARDFLKSITSFVGLIKPFSNPDLSLYYTLTRKRGYKKREGVTCSDEFEGVSRSDEPEDVSRSDEPADVSRCDEPEGESRWDGPWDAERHKPGERTLYITVFDHKERTTRVYTRNDEEDTIYSTKSDAPLVDVGHFILEVEIDSKIYFKGDPVCSDSNNLESLRKHHQSILEHIRYRLGAGDVARNYAIENSWTMKAEDTINTRQRLKLREGNGEADVEKGSEEERMEESLVSDYFMLPSIEKERQLLDERRVKWIARRMEMIAKETNERLLGMGVKYRVDKRGVEKQPIKKPYEVKKMLSQERCGMELLLVFKVKKWEQLFWKKFKTFLDQVGKYRVGETERLTREWRANCWKRLNPQMDAALKRVANLDYFKGKTEALNELGDQWALRASSISQFFEGVENPDGITEIPILKSWRWVRDKESESPDRMQIEIEDAEFRLKRGSELERFDQFWDDNTLFRCRYSRSKWLDFRQGYNTPLEVYSHYLKGNKNITHISFSHVEFLIGFDVDRFLCDLPWVTSTSLLFAPTVPREPLFIHSINYLNDLNDLNEFAKKIKLDPPSTYIFSDFKDPLNFLRGDGSFLISFVAPPSGRSLILRVKHSGPENPLLQVTLGSNNILLDPPSKPSLTIDDITLYPIGVSGPSESDHLLFVPEVRNDIYIEYIGRASLDHCHFLNDIELLDENGLEYMPHSAYLEGRVDIKDSEEQADNLSFSGIVSDSDSE